MRVSRDGMALVEFVLTYAFHYTKILIEAVKFMILYAVKGVLCLECKSFARSLHLIVLILLSVLV